MKNVYVDIVSKSAQIGIGPNADNLTWINKNGLTVHPLFTGNPNYPSHYRYPTRTLITLLSPDHHEEAQFECQDVSNQSGWSTGTLAGLKQAASDLATWIATP